MKRVELARRHFQLVKDWVGLEHAYQWAKDVVKDGLYE